MFLKHIRRNWDVNGGTHVFECGGYSIKPLDNSILLFELDSGVAFEFNDETDDMYVTNNDGRTIDSYVSEKRASQFEVEPIVG